MSIDRSNVVAIARREYLARARTRTFKLTTLLLVLLGLGVGIAPIVLQYLDGESGPTTIEVVVRDSAPSADVVATLDSLLNGPPGSAAGSPRTYQIVNATDEAVARARVLAGESAGVLILGRRAADRELTFEFATAQSSAELLPTLVAQAVATIAVQDRLATRGIPPADQAGLFAPPDFAVRPADPNAPPGETPGGGLPPVEFGLGFVLAIVIYMAIILYGQWIAYSVAEEKSSRVMEVILGAATPFELLTGKVLGVGSLALTQYAIVFVPAALTILFQDRIAALVLGGTAGAVGSGGGAGAVGLSIPILVVFGILLVLGFALYAVLYAGAGALVSRTEDINQIVAPMTIISTIGYLVAVYASTGLLDPRSTPVVILSYVPFFSPYLMLTRFGAGVAGPLELGIAIAILAVSIPVALWIAARFYAAGVLMYGQRPSLRLMLRVLRGAR